MREFSNKVLIRAGVAAALLVIVGCASAPKPVDSLDQVNAEYADASANPVVRQHATLELSEAKDSVSLANQVWKDGKKKSIVEQHAYLASQRIKIAQEKATQRSSEQKITKLQIERQKNEMDVKAKEVEVTRRETQALKYQLLELDSKQTDRGLVMTLGDDLFVPGGGELLPESTGTVAKIAVFLRQYPDKSIKIEGYTGDAGDDDYNYDLSTQRAGSVLIALTDHGVGYDQMKSKGYGEASPVADNATAQGQVKNRRVEVIFPGNPGIVASSE